LVPEWKKVYKSLKGIINVVVVDGDTHKSLSSKYGIQGFPTIKLFGATPTPTTYEGAREAGPIVTWAMSQAQSVVKARLSGKKAEGGSKGAGSKPPQAGSKAPPKKPSESKGSSSGKGAGGGDAGKNSYTLTPENFDELVYSGETPWMVELYAPWCGHCKNLAPEWASAAETMSGEGVRFGAVDADKHRDLGSRFGVKGFPTIKTFPASAKGDGDASDYTGSRDAAGLIAAATKLAEASPGKPSITQIVSQASWNDVCGSKRVCLVAVLPHILDDGAAKRAGRLEVLGEVAGKVRGKPIKVVWWEGGAQEKVEGALGASMPPQAFAVASDKGVWAAHKGAVDVKSLGEFAKSLTGSIKGAAPFPKTFAIDSAFATTTPWDGKDAPAPPAEEPLEL